MMPELEPKEIEVYNLLKGEGFNKNACCGIMGNISVETGGSFDYQQKQSGGGPGRGLFQMQGSKLKCYNKFLQDKNRTDSASSQIKFFKATLEEKKYIDEIGAGNAKKIKTALNEGTAKESYLAVLYIWERPSVPHQDKRLKQTQRYVELFWENKQVINHSKQDKILLDL